MEAATQRRLYEELGLRCPLHFLFKFQYQAQFDETGAEHELCSVFIGRCTQSVKANRDEILDWRWVSPEAAKRIGGRGRAELYALVQARMVTYLAGFPPPNPRFEI
jgi:isopentenyldiphosphate isomerase